MKKRRLLTEHQKEVMRERKVDLPTLYNALDPTLDSAPFTMATSQDTATLDSAPITTATPELLTKQLVITVFVTYHCMYTSHVYYCDIKVSRSIFYG